MEIYPDTLSNKKQFNKTKASKRKQVKERKRNALEIILTKQSATLKQLLR